MTTSPQKTSKQNLQSYRGLWPSYEGWAGPQIDLSYHPDLTLAAGKILQLYKSPGCIILAGNPGSGKTTFARILEWSWSGLVDEMNPTPKRTRRLRSTPSGIISVWNYTYWDEPSLLDSIRESWKLNEYIREISQSDLLILDDLGAGYVKSESLDWYQSIFWRLINDRVDKRTLITTNLHPAKIRDLVGPRSWSRLKEVMGQGQDQGMDGLINMFAIPDYRSKDWKNEES